MMYERSYAHDACRFGLYGRDKLEYDVEGFVTKFGSPEGNRCVSDCESDDLQTELNTVKIMWDEGRRLRTYTKWPTSSFQLPTQLAEAGFFYTGTMDRVKCAFCLGVLKQWNPNDIPFVEHQKHFPHCRFIQGEDVGNIPLGQSGFGQVLSASEEALIKDDFEERTSRVPKRKYPELPKLDIAKAMDRQNASQLSHQSQSQYQKESSTFVCQTVSTREPLKIPSEGQSVASSGVLHNNKYSACSEKSSYPPILKDPRSKISTDDYTYEANRLATFLRWPLNNKLEPDVVARAGFYFAPTEVKPDRVKCGYCGGKLFGWQEGDDPMVEHARCFPACPYVKMCSDDGTLPTKAEVALPISSSFSSGSKNSSTEPCPSNSSKSNPGHNNISSGRSVNVSKGNVSKGLSTHLDVSENNVSGQDDITVVMHNENVLQVQAMGFPREKLERIVRQTGRRQDGGHLSVQELVEAVLQCDSE